MSKAKTTDTSTPLSLPTTSFASSPGATSVLPSLPGSPISQPGASQGLIPKPPSYELRVFGLNPAGALSGLFDRCINRRSLLVIFPTITVTADNLIAFFAANTRVLGVLLHPAHDGQQNATQWAQIWVSSQEELQKCIELKSFLAPSGITISPAPSASLPLTSQSRPSPIMREETPVFDIRAPPTPPSLSRGVRSDYSIMSFKHVDPQGPLPRNLYVMGLPLDLSQIDFKALFSQFGMVEHSTLLSQLDGAGRRRGFILMSTHREAAEAMQAMNGCIIEGKRIDVSWALVQRETKNIGQSIYGAFPNRVIHPPSASARREPPRECSVVVENLSSFYFPNAGTVRDVFAHFGPVSRVTILSTSPLQALIQFEHEVSATALLNANGLSIGGRSIITRPYGSSALTPTSSRESSSATRINFDPFKISSDLPERLSKLSMLSTPSRTLTTTSLNAESEPFVPLPSPVNWYSQPLKTINNNSSAGRTSGERSEDFPSPSTRSPSGSNENSDSTKASHPGTVTVTASGQTDKTDEKKPMRTSTAWPSVPAAGGSRWTNAPNFCERY
ncbi:hypothetical protein I316_03895 [Kwoniella heveanensis BCC8398]|uniref:RRM domain-containing protein n=1 Tax=Kwoniella heveanensis BCC8398 TaxID=1296120 RepID=A0A1B9GTM2_9TREE|nr:hypothetical protein I316_03895 [Kwoniella heveanensis BCC8398]